MLRLKQGELAKINYLPVYSSEKLEFSGESNLLKRKRT